MNLYCRAGCWKFVSSVNCLRPQKASENEHCIKSKSADVYCAENYPELNYNCVYYIDGTTQEEG